MILGTFVGSFVDHALADKASPGSPRQRLNNFGNRISLRLSLRLRSNASWRTNTLKSFARPHQLPTTCGCKALMWLGGAGNSRYPGWNDSRQPDLRNAAQSHGTVNRSSTKSQMWFINVTIVTFINHFLRRPSFHQGPPRIT